MSTGIRTSRLGLYVGMILALPASVALEGAGLWLALGPQFRIATGAIAALVGGALTCLIGTVLIGVSVLRERARHTEDARPAPVVPRPRTAEEAAGLAHSQKMEALGLLVGEVAHDFNNLLLDVIRNALEILRLQDPQYRPRLRCLEMIRHSADPLRRSPSSCSRSRRQPLEVRPVDANELVGQMAELLRHSLGGRITVENGARARDRRRGRRCRPARNRAPPISRSTPGM